MGGPLLLMKYVPYERHPNASKTFVTIFAQQLKLLPIRKFIPKMRNL